MPSHINALAVRRELNRGDGGGWGPPRPAGPDGWMYGHDSGRRSVLVTCADHHGVDWVHASMTGAQQVPGYDDLVLLHRAVYGTGWAYQVFAPPAQHVNIHERCLHLFGRLDGAPVLPDFTYGTGSI